MAFFGGNAPLLEGFYRGAINVTPPVVSFEAGLNFRQTSGYVTDVAPDTYCTFDAYPTTRGGYTFGWTAGSIDGRNRNAGVDPQLAGINFAASGACTLRFDLPAPGTYDIRLAIGDGFGGNPFTNDLVLKDNTTTLATINASTGGNQFADAAGNIVFNTLWESTNVAISKSFATTTLIIVIGTSAVTALVHLGIVRTA
jgi:hypothetical protein